MEEGVGRVTVAGTGQRVRSAALRLRVLATATCPRPLFLAAAWCAAVGAFAWTFYLRALFPLLGEDWMVYYAAIRTYFDGALSSLYDGGALTARINARFADWLAQPLPLHPFLYPPPFLVLLLPFGMLRPALAGGLFMLVGLAGLALACVGICRDRKAIAICACSLLAAPATALTVCLGQNSFLTCALVIGGFALLRRRPTLAGLLLGAAAYKPQLVLLVPVALLAGRDWRALAAAATTALLLALASVAVFGLEPWRAWLELMVAPNPTYAHWNALTRLDGESVYSYAALLGAPGPVASLLQAVSLAAAAAAVWWSFRTLASRPVTLAILLAATMLSAPHLLAYDGLMLDLAVTLLYLRHVEDGLTLGESLLLAALWASPLLDLPSAFRAATATPVLIAVLLVWAALRERGGIVSPARRLAA